MKTRRLVADDLPAVVSIQKGITRSEPSSRWQEMLARHIGSGERAGFVAEEDGQVVGFIIGEVKVGGFGADLTGWIEMVGVRPERMGTGIGQALAKRVCQYFRSEGVLDICTSVRWDSGDMLAFFKSQGFEQSPFINLLLRLPES